jgi:solute carrier family 31 (copper transporter), member 1
MFAGSCIGVICLVVSLEFLRRLQRGYEQRIRGNFKYHYPRSSSNDIQEDSTISNTLGKTNRVISRPLDRLRRGTSAQRFRPGILQQVIRAALHMVQFGVAYFIMLLAMYYNGYFIICILIGAFVGSFIFGWDQMDTR